METKQQYESYLKWLLEDLGTSIEYRDERDYKERRKVLEKLLWEKLDKDINQDEMDDRFRQHWDCLEINTYKEEWDESHWALAKIIDILLACGWPNIRLRLETRRDSAELNYYRGGEHYTYRFFSREEIDMLFSLFDLDC